ncbi:hypothetical protein SAMN02745163_00827 [Clostridium cavendishii DSM 21758]|uniref:ABC-2 family transporter protein n=1 Tax=Clostridium cavendishii DSM 21758 TaxID=1121302 RepID=A0A1M6EDG9_9CLOT|nr:hypothetical protein [Clostridium cavendishii]SHI83526.1 hypothetical protein SAMN02745163_00827 [Clostridium cavendishii DSM 21758]
MFTLCKILYEKNKALVVMGVIGILIIAIVEATTNKYKIDSMYTSFYMYYWILYLWVLIIAEFRKETSIFFMPIRKQDIIKGYYIFSLLYFIIFTLLNICVRMVVFKLYNASEIPFERLSILGVQELLFLINIVWMILPLGILCKRWIGLMSLFLFYVPINWFLDNEFSILKNNMLISISLTMFVGYISYKIVLILFERKVCIE